MLTVPEKEFCRIFAATQQTLPDALAVADKVWGEGRHPLPHEIVAREDIQFEVQCKAAQHKHKAQLLADAASILIVNLSTAEIRAREETMLTLIGDLQMIQKRQADGLRISPGEARFLETACRATGLIGEANVNISMPVVTAADAEALEARRKAAMDRLSSVRGNA